MYCNIYMRNVEVNYPKKIVARTSRTVSKNLLQEEVVQRKSYQIMEKCLSRRTVHCLTLNGGSHGSWCTLA